MAESELIPSNAEVEANGKTPLVYTRYSAGYPEGLIKFGYVPDLSKMQMGDIILCRTDIADDKKSDENIIRKYIGKVHNRRHTDDNSKWVHVGLYIGRDRMIEAMRPAVRLNTFSERAMKECIKVMRMPADRLLVHSDLEGIDDAKTFFGFDALSKEQETMLSNVDLNAFFSRENLSAEQLELIAGDLRVNVCLEAMKQLGKRYDIWETVKIWNRKESYSPSTKSKKYICSTLVADAYIHAADVPVFRMVDNRSPTPADISSSPFLKSVDIGWRPLQA